MLTVVVLCSPAVSKHPSSPTWSIRRRPKVHARCRFSVLTSEVAEARTLESRCRRSSKLCLPRESRLVAFDDAPSCRIRPSKFAAVAQLAVEFAHVVLILPVLLFVIVVLPVAAIPVPVGHHHPVLWSSLSSSQRGTSPFLVLKSPVVLNANTSTQTPTKNPHLHSTNPLVQTTPPRNSSLHQFSQSNSTSTNFSL